MELRDVAPGLWLWRGAHPDWSAGSDWEAEVASFAVESRGVRLLLDPLAPSPGEREAWERIDAFAPDVAVVLKPDHVRDVDTRPTPRSRSLRPLATRRKEGNEGKAYPSQAPGRGDDERPGRCTPVATCWTFARGVVAAVVSTTARVRRCSSTPVTPACT